MRKLTFLLLIIIFSGGCATRKALIMDSGVDNTGNAKFDLNKVTANNISNTGFIINRIDVELSGNDQKHSVIAAIRYNAADRDLLINLRSNMGIEIARIYAGTDTVVIIDRFNEQLIYGKPDYFARKFGFHPDEIFIALGDIKSDNIPAETISECVAGSIVLNSTEKYGLIKYHVNCRKNKAEKIELWHSDELNKLLIEIGRIKTDGLFIYGHEIKIGGIEAYGEINLRIKGIQKYVEAISIPGARENYEKVHLK